MYFRNSDHAEPVVLERSNSIVIMIATVITLVIGIVPGLVSEMFRF
jgi:NADH:ubiquinone oxidoreductase subunit 2 (subunit N)